MESRARGPKLPGQAGVMSRLSGSGGRGWRDTLAAVRSPTNATRVDLVALLGLATAAGVYFVLRYQGHWMESDSGVMGQATRLITNTADLAPATVGVYSNGYGYQVISLAIMAFTGLRLETLQQLVYPIISALLVLPSWLLYRELTGNARTATIATLLLLLVPEHLFAVLRASHERLDRVFLMTALWLLVRSMRFRDDASASRVHVVVVLVMTYALVATNVLFGMSFVAALITAFVLSRIAQIGPAGVRALARQTTPLFRWSSAAAALIVVLFVALLYPPFGTSLRILMDIPARILDLLLTGGASFDPYASVRAVWASPLVYLALSSMNLIVLVASALIWLWLGVAWARGGRPESAGIWALWLLYAAFAAQGAASLASDLTGALDGNVQLRAFAVFATVATPLVAVALARWRPGPVLRGVSSLAVGVAMGLALMKASLEPALANKWLFYTQAEVQTLGWADDQQADAAIWVGPDDRIIAAYALEIGNPTFTERLRAFEPSLDVDTVLVSDLIRLQSARLGIALPDIGSMNRLYDNGEVQLYR